jgi:hypothetical protein
MRIVTDSQESAFVHKTLPATILTVAALTCGHVIAAEHFCIVHPYSQSCDNPTAPRPELPHEAPTVTALSTANGTVAFLGSRTS